MKIKPNEAQKIINENNLKLHKNIWHYSFNELFRVNEFTLKKINKDKILLYTIPHNQFSPLPLYANFDEQIEIKENNFILSKFNLEDESKRNVYWFLKITTFNDFLEKRSKSSSKPKKHFPTLESYEKIKNKINGEVIIDKFNKDFFYENYDKLKLPEHLTGEEIFNLFVNNNKNFDLSWLKTAAVLTNNEITAIAILIDDGKSLNLENIAAKRDPLGYGVYLCAELVNYCADKKYYSFDAGVSGLYGNYKQKIFIDSWEVYRKKESVSQYFKIWEIDYWRKVKNKLKK